MSLDPRNVSSAAGFDDPTAVDSAALRAGSARLTTQRSTSAVKHTASVFLDTAYNLTGPNSTPYDDFDGDGHCNLVEFAINTDPKTRTAGLILAARSMGNLADHKRYFTVNHRHRNAPGSRVYQFQGSTNLNT